MTDQRVKSQLERASDADEESDWYVRHKGIGYADQDVCIQYTLQKNIIKYKNTEVSIIRSKERSSEIIEKTHQRLVDEKL